MNAIKELIHTCENLAATGTPKEGLTAARQLMLTIDAKVMQIQNLLSESKKSLNKEQSPAHLLEILDLLTELQDSRVKPYVIKKYSSISELLE